MAPSQGGRSSCWSGETAARNEPGSSSPEESLSDDGTSSVSDITLHNEEESTSSQADDIEPSHRADVHSPISPTIFPFHLIAGCSSANRNMCTSSGSHTLQEVKTVLGLRGTLRSSRGRGGLHWWTPRRWTLGVPSSLPRQLATDTRPCRNTRGISMSQADDGNSSPSSR